MSESRKVVIIGSGPAGLTAAIYAARANLDPLVFEGSQPGGQLMITTDVENYPGFPDGIMGPEIMDLFRAQAHRFGAETRFEHVTKVDFSSRPIKVWVENRLTLADAVIISTGATARLIGLESETRLMGHGVSACATCDGFFFKDKEVIVVGGGDSAMEEANFLTKFASKVTIIHRRNQLRATRLLEERAFAEPKIEFLWDTTVEKIEGEDFVKRLRLHQIQTGEKSSLEIAGIFIAIGFQPETDFLKGTVPLDPVGHIITNEKMETATPGILAAGDIRQNSPRQAITAAGDGATAAIYAERFLTENE